LVDSEPCFRVAAEEFVDEVHLKRLKHEGSVGELPDRLTDVSAAELLKERSVGYEGRTTFAGFLAMSSEMLVTGAKVTGRFAL
jgi:hypothetical protein